MPAKRAPGRRVEPRSVPDAQAASDHGPWRGATLALAVTLAVLVAVRALLVFVPSMAGWGLNVARFLPAWAAWPLTLAAALSLVPAFARRVAPAFERTGEWLANGGAVPLAAAAILAALFVLAIPDRVWYVGDFLLRQGAIVEKIGAARVFPQALPLDRLLHNVLPTWLASGPGLDANAAGRILGALAAAGLMVAAVAFARALELNGGVAAATIAVVFFGGYLGVFTGYSKAVVELCALTAGVGACALRVLRTGRGLVPLGAVLSIAFLLHRSALGLLPVAILTWAMWLRDPVARATVRSPVTLAGLALPWVALTLMLPKALRTFRDVDLAVHLAPAEVRERGGMLAAAFTGLHLLDLGNTVLMLAPLALVIPVLLAARRRDAGRTRELVMLLVLAAPLVGMIPFIHPVQGMFRDWDNFVAGGVALSLIAAWLVAETLRDSRRRTALAVGVTVCAATFTLQWMVHHTDVEGGLRRMRAFLHEPPARSESERVAVLDYIGIRSVRLERYAEAATAFREAADQVPNPRFMIQWGLAATEARDYRDARAAYERMIARTPADPLAWRGYTAMSSRLGDLVNARRGATELLARVPGDPDAVRLLAEIDRVETAERPRVR